MASPVEICNLALAHLGDTAVVTDIAPPDGSVQAEFCARFYPRALDSTIEARDWAFATRRAALSPLAPDNAAWQYVYAAPSGMVRAIRMVEANSDWPQAFKLASYFDGSAALYANTESAHLIYTVQVDDTARLPPAFVDALSWRLAADLAGPLIKGKTGAEETQRCMQMFRAKLGEAAALDANQQQGRTEHRPDWIAQR